RSGTAIPARRLRLAASEAASASLVEQAEVVHRIGVAHLGGLAIEPRGLGLALRHPAALLVHDAKRVERAAMSCVGGLPVPPRRLRLVFVNAISGLVEDSEAVHHSGPRLLPAL